MSPSSIGREACTLPPSAAACLNTFRLHVERKRDSETIEKWPVIRQQGGGAWERGGRGRGGRHDRQEKLLMDSSDSCDPLLRTRQVPPLRGPTVCVCAETC